MTRRVAGTLAGIAAVAALAAWYAWPGVAPPPAGALLRPDDARVLAAGERVYRTHCAACHGAALEGQPNWQRRGDDGLLPAPPHDAGGHTWHHADAVLFMIAKHGVAKAAGMPDYRSAMPVYDGALGDDDIVAVLSWIKSRWPPEIRDKHDQINQATSR